MWCEKLVGVGKQITVEPVLFLYMLATFSQYAIFQDLVYSKVCLAEYNSTICDDLHVNSNSTDYKDILDFVQKTCSHWILLSTISTVIPSIFISIYLGSWSDRFGRKWPVAIPPLGGVLGSLVYIIISFEPSAPVLWICFASFLPGMTGGFVSCIMSCMTYVSAVTTDEQRTVRVSRLEAMIFLGGTIGPFISGSMLPYTGHGYAFAFMMLCYMTAFLYAAILVKDVPGLVQVSIVYEDQNNENAVAGRSVPVSHDLSDKDLDNSSREEVYPNLNSKTSPLKNRESPIEIIHSRESEEETREFLANSSIRRNGKESCCVKYFGSKHFFEAVSTCCKPRDENRRLYILMIICAGFIAMMITAGSCIDICDNFSKSITTLNMELLVIDRFSYANRLQVYSNYSVNELNKFT